jgi:hypothetical protein
MIKLRKILFLTGLLVLSPSQADTMVHFMHIATSLPQMEMKADPQAQAWARSARNILELTSESVYESLVAANVNATRTGNPLFCLPNETPLSPTQMSALIQSTFQNLPSQQSDKEKMSVSQVALIGLSQAYPCANSFRARPRISIQHRGQSMPLKALAAAAMS